jgi:16S rRNA U1498 N3-methylase RsmE
VAAAEAKVTKAEEKVAEAEENLQKMQRIADAAREQHGALTVTPGSL